MENVSRFLVSLCEEFRNILIIKGYKSMEHWSRFSLEYMELSDP